MLKKGIKRIRTVLIASFCLLAVIFVLLHTKPVRNLVLHSFESYLEKKQGLRFRALALDYNLVLLRLKVKDVSLSRLEGTGLPPILEAEEISVRFPLTLLFKKGIFLSRLKVLRPSFYYFIDSGGQSKLPVSTEPKAFKMPTFRLKKVDITDAQIRYRDEENQTEMELAGLNLALHHLKGYRHSFQIKTEKKGYVRYAALQQEVKSLLVSGEIDESSVEFERIDLDVSRSQLDFSGKLNDFFRPSLSGTLGGVLDLEDVRWIFPDERTLSGRLNIVSEIDGPLENPRVGISLEGESLSFMDLKVVSLDAQAFWSDGLLSLSRFELSAAGGRIQGEASLHPLDWALGNRVELFWKSFDLESLEFLSEYLSTFSSGTSGSLQAAWSDFRLDAVEGRAEMHVYPQDGIKPSAEKIPLTSLFKGNVHEGRVSLSVEDLRIPGLQGEGSIQIDKNSLKGEWNIESEDLKTGISTFSRMLNTAGQEIFSQLDVEGSIKLWGDLKGDFHSPIVRSEFKSEKISYQALKDLTVKGNAVYHSSGIEIESTLTHPDIGQIVLAGFYPLAPSEVMDFFISGERLVLEKIVSLVGQDFPATASLDFSASVTGKPKDLTVKSEWSIEDLTLYGETLEKVDLALTYKNQELKLESFVGSKGDGSLKASGWVDFSRKEYSTKFSVESLRLEGLQLPGIPNNFGTIVDLAGESRGTLHSPQVFAEGVLSDCFFGDSKLGDLQIRTNVSESQSEFWIDAPFFKSHAEGSILINSPFKLAATLQVNGLLLERLFGLYPIRLEKELAGELQARFDLAMDLAQPSETLDIQASVNRIFLKSGLFQIQNGRPIVFALDSKGLKIEDLQIKGNGVDIEGSGTLAWRKSEKSDLSVKVDVDLAPISDLFPELSAAGRLHLNSRLKGVFQQSEIFADLQLFDGRFAHLRFPEVFENIQFRVEAKNNQIDIQSCSFSLGGLESVLVGKIPFPSLPVSLPILSRSQEAEHMNLQLSLTNSRAPLLKGAKEEANNRIQVTGSAGLADDKDLDLDVKGELDFSLVQAFVKNVQMSGRCDFDFRLMGSPALPRFEGSLEIHDGGMSMTAPRIFLENMAGRIQFEDNRILLKDVHGILNGGNVYIVGGVGLDGWSLSEGEIALKTENILFNISRSLRSQISSDLKFNVSKEEKVLSGTILVLYGQYTEPIDLKSSFFHALRRGSSSRPVPQKTSQWLDSLRWQVDVITLNPFVVDNNLLRSQFTAATTLTGTYRQFGLTGRLESLEGGKLFFGKNAFLIQQATVDFINPRRIEPDLNVTAVTKVGEYDIQLNISGTPEELSAALTSDPPLTEPNLISLLVTGTTLEGASSSLLSAAGSEAVTYLDSVLTGKLESALERSLGLESVRIDAGLISSIDNPGARITLQQHLARNLELILSQNLQTARNRLWVLEYNPLPSINVQGVKEDNNELNVSFRHEIRFGLKGAEKSPYVRKRRVIDGVLLEGSLHFPERKIKNRLHLRVGSRYDNFRFYEGLDRIRELYFKNRFLNSSIVPSRTDKAGKMEIVLRIETGQKVTFEFSGAPVPQRIKTLASRLWMLTPVERLAFVSIEDRLKEHFMNKRYFQVTVHHDILSGKEGDIRVVFKISPGIKYKKPEFHFEGNRSIPNSKLQEVVKRRSDLVLLFLSPRTYVRELKDFYAKNGFLQARLEEPKIYLFPEESTASVSFPIQEGPQYRIESIAFEGNLFLDTTVLKERIGIRENDVYRQDVVEKAVFVVEEAYARKGFNRVEVDVLSDVDDENRIVHLSFGIQENQQESVGEIRITGNPITLEKIIIREFELKKGDPIDYRILNKARKRLYDLGIFKRVQIDAVPLEDGRSLNCEVASSPYSRPYRIEIDVAELQPYRFRYGLQYDTETSIGLSTELVNRNLMGRAMLAGASFRLNSEETDLKGFYRSPYFFSKKISSEFFIFFNSSEKPAFSLDRSGLTIQQQTKWSQFSILSYSYSYEKVRTFYNALSLEGDVSDSVQHVGMLNVSVSRDTRDNILNASRGLFFSQNLGFADEWLGSDVRFIRYFGELYTYKKISDSFVYAFAFRIGLGKGLGQEFSLSQRFFAGGGTTIRGFKKNEVGPKDPVSGLAQGGDAVLILNHELRFPIYKRWTGAVFLDLGNVYGRLPDFNPFDLRETAGFGLRFQAGFLLIRVDWGFKLDRRPGESLSGIFLSIGQVF